MADIRIERKGITATDIPAISSSNEAIQGLGDIAKSTATAATNLQKKSEEIYLNNIETDIRQNINRIFNNSPNDPNLVKDKLDKYGEGVFKSAPFQLRAELKNSYDKISSPLVTKAFTNKSKELTNQLIVSTAAAEDQVLIDIQRDVGDIFIHSNDLSNDEKLLQQSQSFQALEANLESYQKIISRKGPDGQFLYTAQQQVSKISNASHVALSTASKQWLDQQPNKLKALREWRDGTLSIPFSDGETLINVPVHSAFNPAIVDKVEKELIARARNELSISDKAEKHQERLRDRVADNVANEFFSRASRGELDVDVVENARGILKPKDFKSNLVAARSKVVVQDGVTYNALFQKANDGEDVTDEATAALEQGLLNPEGYTRLISINRRDEHGFKNPVEEGRSVLRGILSGVYTPDEGVKHRLYSQGERAYNDAVRERKTETGVALTIEETQEIADQVGTSFSDRPESAITKTRPKYGPIALLGNSKTRTVVTVNEIHAETVRFFMDKWDGNKAAAASDIAYKQQRKLIKEWEAIAIQNEQRISLREARKAQRKR